MKKGSKNRSATCATLPPHRFTNATHKSKIELTTESCFLKRKELITMKKTITFDPAEAREFTYLHQLHDVWPGQNEAVRRALWTADDIDPELAKRANKMIAEQYNEELAEAEKNPGDYISDNLLHAFGDPISALIERLQDGEIDDDDAENELEDLVYQAITEELARYSSELWNHWDED